MLLNQKVAIMQPYFLPYIGYFQLINAVDVFVIYDNIQFSKNGWFHRNRFLQKGKPEYFTLPLKKDSDFLNVNERNLSDNWSSEKDKIIRRLKENYRKAPFFEQTIFLAESIFNFETENLFEFVHNSVLKVCQVLKINTPIVISSTLQMDHSLKSPQKIYALCKTLNAKNYINPIGGLELYNKDEFKENGLNLSFIKSRTINYTQFNFEFVPWLSILDLMMFNSLDQIKLWLNEYDEICD